MKTSTAVVRQLVVFLVLVLAGCAGTGGRLPLTKEGRLSVETMAREAHEASQSMATLVAIRPRTPEWLMLRLEWRKNELDARLLLTEVPVEREQFIQEYLEAMRTELKELEARMAVDTTTAALGEAQFAVAEGEYLLARMQHPDRDRPDLLLVMDAKTEMTSRGILDLENIRPRTPEFGMLRWEWLQRSFEMRVRRASSDKERMKLADENLADAKTYLQDAGRILDGPYPHDRFYYVAWAEYRTASLAASLPDQQKASEKLTKEANETVGQLRELMAIRPNTPEFLSLQLKWSKMLLNAQMLTASSAEEKHKYRKEYAERLQTLKQVVLKRDDLTTPEPYFFEYSLAEAEYLQTLPQ